MVMRDKYYRVCRKTYLALLEVRSLEKLLIRMAASYWALQICAKRFDEYLNFGETQTSLVIFSNMISWLY